MAERGGYRAPANPAPVSGPGALSQRTDSQPAMQMPDAAYGEQAEFQAIQGAAPMYASAGPPPTPLTAPTERPDVPVTDGAAMGPGAGPEALGVQEDGRREMSNLAVYMPMMERMAYRPDAPRAFRALVQYIKAFNG